MCVHSIKATGPLVEKDIGGIFKTSIIKRLNAAGQIMVGETKRHTPVNIGTLRGSIAATGARWTGGNVFENRVSTPQRYGIVIEFGRKAPGPMPPIGPLELWVRRKGKRLGFPQDNTRHMAFLIARKIARRGFREKYGYKMFFNAMVNKRHDVTRLIGEDVIVEIAAKLN